MGQTVGDFFWQRLHEWGVRTVFGYPGDGINGFLGALDRTNGQFKFVQVRHEEMAAFMASAYAKFTGEVGVCMATSGPGASHLITGLYDARMDHMPVLAIAGQQARDSDRRSLSAGTRPAQHVQGRRRRFRAAGERAGAGPPHGGSRDAHRQRRAARHGHDLPERSAGGAVRGAAARAWHGAFRRGLHARPRSCRTSDDLRRAAEVLNAGKKVAILVGAGALHATDEVIAVADTLGAGVAKALLGKAVLPDDLPWVTGSIGLLGTKPSWELMSECDTLLMIGSGFPYSEFLPKEGQARGVQIDIEPEMLSLRYPMEVNLVGDSARDAARAAAAAEAKDRSFVARADREERRRMVEDAGERAMASANPVNPQRVVWELSPRLPERAIITSDSGSCANWYARDLKIRRGMMCSLSGGLASMGAAVPYAIAAKFAHPDRPVIALVGDGAMQMNNMAELITVAKYWREWADPHWVVCVFNNQDLNQVTWEQRVHGG